jgi:cobalt-zinc-cadmium efflux system membrane fusion protein
MKRLLAAPFLIALVSVLLPLSLGCKRTNEGFTGSSRNAHLQTNHSNQSTDYEHGDHGGRLLREGSFSLELKIFELGVPPQYRIYAYKDSEAISPDRFTASVSLERLGGRKEIYHFVKGPDFLTSEKEVEEPHSFRVEVRAEFEGNSYSWQFESYEGRTTIPDDAAKLSGVRTQRVTSRPITTTSRIRGRIHPSEHRIAHIIPRFSGLVREGRKHIGDRVEEGEVVAVIESNQSLQPFEVRSQISGTVVSGHVVVGEFVPENQSIYTIADMSEVWADFFVPLSEQIELKIGQRITISSLNFQKSAEGAISYIAPYVDEKSQSQLARVVLPNPEDRFLPGMFVLGDLVVNQRVANAAVKLSAIQSFRDWKVVFGKYGETYEIKPLHLGQSDGEWVEVLQGLSVGDEYVTENSFLIKADILKSGASHDH